MLHQGREPLHQDWFRRRWRRCRFRRTTTAAAAAARKDMRQPFERLARLLQSGRDLIGVGPRRRIQALRQRVQRLAPRRVADPPVDPLADRGYHSARNAICSSGVAPAIVDGIGFRPRRPPSGGGPHGTGCRLRARGADRRRRALLAAPSPRLRPPPALFDRRFDDLLVVADRLPVERDVGMVRLDLAQHVRLQRIAADADAAGRAEDVQNPRSLPVPVAKPVHQVRGLVPALVANHAQERHGGLPALLCSGGTRCRLRRRLRGTAPWQARPWPWRQRQACDEPDAAAAGRLAVRAGAGDAARAAGRRARRCRLGGRPRGRFRLGLMIRPVHEREADLIAERVVAPELRQSKSAGRWHSRRALSTEPAGTYRWNGTRSRRTSPTATSPRGD